MPRSGTGVVCGNCLEPSLRRLVPSSRILGAKRVVGGFLNPQSHHPGAGRASACPSSAEEGSNNVQFPDSRESGNPDRLWMDHWIPAFAGMTYGATDLRCIGECSVQ